MTTLNDIIDDLEFLVPGCTSQVWLVPRVGQGEPPALEFAADADAQIV